MRENSVVLRKEIETRWESYHDHGGRAQLKWIHNHMQVSGFEHKKKREEFFGKSMKDVAKKVDTSTTRRDWILIKRMGGTTNAVNTKLTVLELQPHILQTTYVLLCDLDGSLQCLNSTSNHDSKYARVEGCRCSQIMCGEDPNVSELKAQWFYRFLQDTYFWHPTAFAIMLYLYGGFPYLAWVMGVRVTVLYLLTFIPFYVIHKWGTRPWNTPDTSTNSWWVSLLCLGEGWHNNHHAFPRSARHGLEWWQLDLTWELIKFLEVVGLATDVKVPTEADKLKRKTSFGSSQTNR